MTFNIPKEFLGKPITGALEQILSKTPTVTKPVASGSPVRSASGSVPAPSDLASWIILEGRSHGATSYGDLYVAMHRLGSDAAVQKVARDLSVSVGDTGTEKDGTAYIGNINWNTALSLNSGMGNQTLTIRQFMDFSSILREGIRGKKKVYDGTGAEINVDILKKVYDEIWGKRDPWRSEWLDASFVEDKGTLLLYQRHKIDPMTRTLFAQSMGPVQQHMPNNGYVSLSRLNEQGLPTVESQKQSLYYWAPSAGKVARFSANSSRAYLLCDRGPQDSNSALGVRAVREKN